MATSGFVFMVILICILLLIKRSLKLRRRNISRQREDIEIVQTPPVIPSTSQTSQSNDQSKVENVGASDLPENDQEKLCDVSLSGSEEEVYCQQPRSLPCRLLFLNNNKVN